MAAKKRPLDDDIGALIPKEAPKYKALSKPRTIQLYSALSEFENNGFIACHRFKNDQIALLLMWPLESLLVKDIAPGALMKRGYNLFEQNNLKKNKKAYQLRYKSKNGPAVLQDNDWSDDATLEVKKVMVTQTKSKDIIEETTNSSIKVMHHDVLSLSEPYVSTLGYVCFQVTFKPTWLLLNELLKMELFLKELYQYFQSIDFDTIGESKMTIETLKRQKIEVENECENRLERDAMKQKSSDLLQNASHVVNDTAVGGVAAKKVDDQNLSNETGQSYLSGNNKTIKKSNESVGKQKNEERTTIWVNNPTNDKNGPVPLLVNENAKASTGGESVSDEEMEISNCHILSMVQNGPESATESTPIIAPSNPQPTAQQLSPEAGDTPLSTDMLPVLPEIKAASSGLSLDATSGFLEGDNLELTSQVASVETTLSAAEMSTSMESDQPISNENNGENEATNDGGLTTADLLLNDARSFYILSLTIISSFDDTKFDEIN